MIRYRAEQKAPVICREFSAAADAEQGVIVDLRRSGRASQFQPLRPLDFDRWNGEKQRARKITLGPDAGLGDGFLSHENAKLLGKAGR